MVKGKLLLIACKLGKDPQRTFKFLDPLLNTTVHKMPFVFG